jgi:hypothetical protein
MIDPLLQDYSRYPSMTHWFNPRLLSKLLLNVIVSQTFGQYADRRLMVAALDTVPNKTHLDRATANEFAKDKDGAIWLDFVADLGDGFDATYAIAWLLGRENLQVDGYTLPRGQILVMGGDEVYPAATAAAYKHQLRDPYAFSLRDPDRTSDNGIPIYAIPGNHDWYDGLVHFLAFFCREKPWHIGAWRSQQRRSYFAVKVTENWWVWCIDIQLADDMDQPQADYFKAMADGMPPGTKIILCGAEPGWLYTHTNRKSLRIVSYAAEIARDANRNLTIPIILSGDTHHYSRYASPDGKQFITSGGGGAFLHPTHQLEDEIAIRWLAERDKKLSLKTDPATGAANDTPACYPTREKSLGLLWGNLKFPLTNWDFAILMGVIYWLLAIALKLRPEWDMYVVTFLVFAGTLLGYTKYQEKSDSWAVYVTSIVHGCLHSVAAIGLTAYFVAFNARHFPPSGHWYDVWVWLALLLVEVGISGGLIGSFLFGLNLLVTCRYFNMNHNDAFSAMRLDSHRHFLRMRIKENEVTMYAVALDQVPARDEWRGNPEWGPGKPEQPAFLPARPFSPHLIEKPIVVRV